MTLRQEIRMQGQDLDGYIAHFEELIQHAEYDINSPQTIDMFTRGFQRPFMKPSTNTINQRLSNSGGGLH